MLNFKAKLNNSTLKSRADSSQNPKVLEVNLIKNEMRVDFDVRKHLGTLLFSLAVTALFVAEIYFGLNWWSAYENERVLATEAKFNQVSKEIKDMKSESDQILVFKQRVDLADSLLANHIYWTNFFAWLEKNTLSTVNYNGFSGKIDGNYDLQASADTFRDISWQTRALLADPSVLSVKVDSGSSQLAGDAAQDNPDGSISFSVNLKINPQLFKANNQ